jgi:hypothetical protein
MYISTSMYTVLHDKDRTGHPILSLYEDVNYMNMYVLCDV